MKENNKYNTNNIQNRCKNLAQDLSVIKKMFIPLNIENDH